MEPIVDVLIETAQGNKHKYEYDHQRGAMRLDRRLYSAVSFSADYGFVADTEGADGEPWTPWSCWRTPPSQKTWVEGITQGNETKASQPVLGQER